MRVPRMMGGAKAGPMGYNNGRRAERSESTQAKPDETIAADAIAALQEPLAWRGAIVISPLPGDYGLPVSTGVPGALLHSKNDPSYKTGLKPRSLRVK